MYVPFLLIDVFVEIPSVILDQFILSTSMTRGTNSLALWEASRAKSVRLVYFRKQVPRSYRLSHLLAPV